MLASTKGKQPSFSIEIMLECLDDNYFLNLSPLLGEENSANISTERRFEIIRTISKPFPFKTTYKNVS